jgi:hypothetical protein
MTAFAKIWKYPWPTDLLDFFTPSEVGRGMGYAAENY